MVVEGRIGVVVASPNTAALAVAVVARTPVVRPSAAVVQTAAVVAPAVRIVVAHTAVEHSAVVRRGILPFFCGSAILLVKNFRLYADL